MLRAVKGYIASNRSVRHSKLNITALFYDHISALNLHNKDGSLLVAGRRWCLHRPRKVGLGQVDVKPGNRFQMRRFAVPLPPIEIPAQIKILS